MTCLDLFCGCGGLSKGFELAGFKIVGGVDFNAPAVRTFQKNFPKAKGVCCDLLKMEPEQIASEFGMKGVDVIIGGPPCQGFSTANRYAEEKRDPRNKLFFQFVKFVDVYAPKAIVIENVRGILTMNKGYAAKRIREIFRERGYSVANSILNAADFGVPQKRLRNFFVMLRDGEAFDFGRLKTISNCPTVVEAIGELYPFNEVEAGRIILQKTPSTKFQKYLRSKDSVVENHDVRFPAQIVQDRIACVPQGGNWQDVPPEMWPTARNNRHSSAYKRLKEDAQSCTIDTGNNHSNYFHPLYNRLPTVREAARLQSFPDSFVFTGNRSEQYRQVGNAVPPLLSKSIADLLVRMLK